MNELKYRLRKVGGIGDDAADFIEQQASEIERLKADIQTHRRSFAALKSDTDALQAKLSAMEAVDWKTYIVAGCVNFQIGNQSFRLDFHPEDEEGMTRQKHLELMQSMLDYALCQLATAPKVAQPPIEDERKAAEQEYSIAAHNYPDAPIGSRDWVLYWAGWLARSTARNIGGQQP